MKRTLFDADTLIDFDYGLLRIFQIKYNNPKLVNPEFINMEEEDVLKMLKEREEDNPLKLILAESVVDQADLYYNEFFKKEKKLIYDNSLIFGATYNLLRTVLYSKLSVIDVYCTDPMQEEKIRSLFGDKVNYVYTRNYDIYHTLIFKNWKSVLLDMDNLLEKCIYLMNSNINYFIDKNGIPHAKDPRLDPMMKILDISFMDFHV